MKMNISKALIIFFMIFSLQAFAKESIPIELKDIGIDEKLGQKVDLSLTFRNEAGAQVQLQNYFNHKKPVMLLFAYYQCPNLCNLFLNGVTESLKQLKWSAGNEFEIITVSINPSEEPKLAAAKKAAHIKLLSNVKAESGWHFLVNNEKLDIQNETNHSKALAEQVGFKYKYNKAESQFAHTAGIVFLTPSGVISRYLYGIQYAQKDLQLALSEASGNKIGTIVDRLLMFCYNYDPKVRTYSFYVMKILRTISILTVVALGLLVYRGNRKKKSVKVSSMNDKMSV